jgi:hypothetical protein
VPDRAVFPRRIHPLKDYEQSKTAIGEKNVLQGRERSQVGGSYVSRVAFVSKTGGAPGIKIFEPNRVPRV